jgi:hypothetical protein
LTPKRNERQLEFLMLADEREVMFGGAAGGGKSDALLMAALQYVEVPGYAAILFRQTHADLAMAGALMDRAQEWLGGTAAKWNSQEKVWTFPSGATLSFGYLSEENHRFRYQSSEFQFIGFDELTQFKERDYRFLFSRLRRTVDNQVPLRMRSGTNPGGLGHLWVKRRFDPEGRRDPVPGRRFVGARLEDNPYLDIPTYERSLAELDSQTRRQYRSGDWTDFGGSHYSPNLWPRYADVGDAYRIGNGAGRTRHIRKAECSRLLTLDWAMGKPKRGDAGNLVVDELGNAILRGDSTAFLVADLAPPPEGLLFLLWAMCERVPMGQNAPRLAEACRRWLPEVVAGDDDNLSETMLLETRRYRDIPLTKPMKVGGKNKLVRSQAAVVRAERGMVYLPQDDHRPGREWVEALSDQLAAFTGADGEPDDLADAFGLMGRLADEFAPGEGVEADEPFAVGEGYDARVYGGDGGGYNGSGVY